MKKLIYLLLLVVFIVGCQSNLEATYNQMEKISKKYDTSFRTEELNVSTLPLGKVNDLIGEIEKVTAKDEPSMQIKEIRLNMLKSSLYWELALKAGPVGFASDGFKCSEKQFLEVTGDYLNKSHYYGSKAIIDLDNFLYTYPEYREVIGFREAGSDKDTRANFFFSPLGWVKSQERYNRELYAQVCTAEALKEAQDEYLNETQ
ncbi:MAG: hypothetical protein Q8R00_00365 [Candidatus Nanoarchaeia archaeon]|nr:hypothetical protein [Candidatus Nanoarchaeia archaeon]